MSVAEFEAQVLHYGLMAGLCSFWLFHLCGWITGVGRVAYFRR